MAEFYKQTHRSNAKGTSVPTHDVRSRPVEVQKLGLHILEDLEDTRMHGQGQTALARTSNGS